MIIITFPHICLKRPTSLWTYSLDTRPGNRFIKVLRPSSRRWFGVQCWMIKKCSIAVKLHRFTEIYATSWVSVELIKSCKHERAPLLPALLDVLIFFATFDKLCSRYKSATETLSPVYNTGGLAKCSIYRARFPCFKLTAKETFQINETNPSGNR